MVRQTVKNVNLVGFVNSFGRSTGIEHQSGQESAESEQSADDETDPGEI